MDIPNLLNCLMLTRNTHPSRHLSSSLLPLLPFSASLFPYIFLSYSTLFSFLSSLFLPPSFSLPPFLPVYLSIFPSLSEHKFTVHTLRMYKYICMHLYVLAYILTCVFTYKIHMHMPACLSQYNPEKSLMFFIPSLRMVKVWLKHRMWGENL